MSNNFELEQVSACVGVEGEEIGGVMVDKERIWSQSCSSWWIPETPETPPEMFASHNVGPSRTNHRHLIFINGIKIYLWFFPLFKEFDQRRIGYHNFLSLNFIKK